MTVWNTAPATRITLFDSAGTPTFRWTLQGSNKEGREIRFTAEGQMVQLGSGASWGRKWAHKGFRQELAIQWAAGLSSTRETYNMGLWETPTELPTGEAHTSILDAAAEFGVSVEPFVGEVAPTFTAIAYEQGPSLRDTKGVVHDSLEIVLRKDSLSSMIVLIPSAATGWGFGEWGYMGWGE